MPARESGANDVLRGRVDGAWTRSRSDGPWLAAGRDVIDLQDIQLFKKKLRGRIQTPSLRSFLFVPFSELVLPKIKGEKGRAPAGDRINPFYPTT